MMSLAGAFIATKQDLEPAPIAMTLGLIFAMWLVSGLLILQKPSLLESIVVKELGRMRSPSFVGRFLFGRNSRKQGSEFAAARLLVYIIFPAWFAAFVSVSLHSPPWIMDAVGIGTLVGTCPLYVWLRQVAFELGNQSEQLGTGI